MPSSALPDPDFCPLCGQPNRCAMQAREATGLPQPPCWCTRQTFSKELLARVPPQARGLACICSVCATAAQERAA